LPDRAASADAFPRPIDRGPSSFGFRRATAHSHLLTSRRILQHSNRWNNVLLRACGPPNPDKKLALELLNAEARVANCPAAAPAAVEPPVKPQVRVVQIPPTVEAPPPRHNFEVIVSKCEERLRVGSDYLFDFDRAEVRAEGGPTLEIAANLPPPKMPS
jgi:hypothetical protein